MSPPRAYEQLELHVARLGVITLMVTVLFPSTCAEPVRVLTMPSFSGNLHKEDVEQDLVLAVISVYIWRRQCGFIRLVSRVSVAFWGIYSLEEPIVLSFSLLQVNIF